MGTCKVKGGSVVVQILRNRRHSGKLLVPEESKIGKWEAWALGEERWRIVLGTQRSANRIDYQRFVAKKKTEALNGNAAGGLVRK